MSADAEYARAKAYQESLAKRAAARQARLNALRGSRSARKALDERWEAWRPLDGPLTPPPTSGA